MTVFGASWEESKHPRWPAGAAQGLGGQFAPKDGALPGGKPEEEIDPRVVEVGGDDWNRMPAVRLRQRVRALQRFSRRRSASDG